MTMDTRNLWCWCLGLILCLSSFAGLTSGVSRACFSCRSRGEKGLCRDPFPYNETNWVGTRGIKSVPCPSGWCSKTIEGVRGPQDDYGTATERACLQLPPSDREERCAELKLNNKPSLICFCRGNLCNSARQPSNSLPFLLLFVLPLLSLSTSTFFNLSSSSPSRWSR